MNQEIDEINRRIILLKNNIEEKEYEIRRLNSKIANLSTDMDIFEKIHMNNMDFYIDKTEACKSLTVNAQGKGIIDVLNRLYNRYGESIDNKERDYAEIKQIIVKNIDFFQNEIKRYQNEILNLEYEIEMTYKEKARIEAEEICAN